MQRGLLSYVLEDGIPALILSAIVLLSGMGYGFYVAHSRPATPVAELLPEAAAPAAPASAPAAAEKP
ncbi:hypothetical protein [Comamonas jiangduensis]|uniref:Uncharacterized protein n=1 Tax=Comamonas jiangduensis TaxID=1194168 RepID=A0ABV4IE16_9BURK